MTRIDVGPSATVARARGLPWAGKQEAPSFRAGGGSHGISRPPRDRRVGAWPSVRLPVTVRGPSRAFPAVPVTAGPQVSSTQGQPTLRALSGPGCGDSGLERIADGRGRAVGVDSARGRNDTPDDRVRHSGPSVFACQEDVFPSGWREGCRVSRCLFACVTGLHGRAGRCSSGRWPPPAGSALRSGSAGLRTSGPGSLPGVQSAGRPSGHGAPRPCSGRDRCRRWTSASPAS